METCSARLLGLLILFGLFVAPAYAATEVVTVTAKVGADAVPGGQSGGTAITGTRFFGAAYPGATVTLLKNTIERITTIADANGLFSMIDNQLDATAFYTLYAVDAKGERSIILNYPLVAHQGYLTEVSGIQFPPTITLDKLEVREGDFLTVAGFALPRRLLTISFSGPLHRNYSVQSESSGQYRMTLPLIDFPRGAYMVSSSYGGETQGSKVYQFTIGTANVSQGEALQNIPGDVNFDGSVNLVDFSIIAFWYEKKNPPVVVDLNGDKKVDLADLSILAYYWTN
ncbi:MAG TPA: dockerin type I repeat-containing protein [Candidatus Paceibacterota bacterium]|nr:dockerin type I repeat-containing protein [Candidatus Paceibacterota bacterium]